VIRVEDLPDPVVEAALVTALPAQSYHGSLERQKAEPILAAVEQAGGNITEAAELLTLAGTPRNLASRVIAALLRKVRGGFHLEDLARVPLAVRGRIK
jgi:hypothetical protein